MQTTMCAASGDRQGMTTRAIPYDPAAGSRSSSWTIQPLASVLSLPTHNARSMMPHMVDTVYHLIPQKDGRISVEMA
jgi:hypothetical protein